LQLSRTVFDPDEIVVIGSDHKHFMT